MNKKLFWAVVLGALLLAAGHALHGYFVSQQGVYFHKEQEASFLRALGRGATPKQDNKG